MKTTTAATHTPGPWEAIGSHKAWYIRTYTTAAPGPVITLHEYTALAEIFESETIEEQAANARLIAQAPNLLEALQELLQFVPEVSVGVGVRYERAHNQAISKALAVIAAATGASQP